MLDAAQDLAQALPQPTRIAAQMLADLAAAAAAGIVLQSFWLSPASRTRLGPTLRRALLVASLVLALANALEFLAVTAAMSGATTLTALRSAIPDVYATEAGHTLALTTFAALPLLALALVPSVLPRLRLAALALVVLLTALRTPLGHAAINGPWSLRELVQSLHLAAVEVWGGGVMIAGLLTLPRLRALRDVSPPYEALLLTRNLSRTVTVALPCVLLTGAYNSWLGLGGSLAPLPHTPWGQLLLAKLALVATALALGTRMRLVLHHPRTQENDNAAFLHQWLGVEALAMAALFVLSAWLANTAPAA